MPNKNAEFVRNPKLFMQTYRLRNHLSFDGVSVPQTPQDVAIECRSGDGIWSPFVSDRPADAFPAYCLPYVRGMVTKLQLGRDADFFFTSELNGCTLVIVNSPGNEAPLVAHFAGDLGRNVEAANEAPLRDIMHSSPFTTLHPAGTLARALRSPKAIYAPMAQMDLDHAAAAPGIDRELNRVRGRFGPPEYYDRLTRYDGLQNIVDFEVVGWRKPERGWRFYAQASGRFGAEVKEIRVMTKQMQLSHGETGHPAYVTTIWKGEPPSGGAWKRG